MADWRDVRGRSEHGIVLVPGRFARVGFGRFCMFGCRAYSTAPVLCVPVAHLRPQVVPGTGRGELGTVEDEVVGSLHSLQHCHSAKQGDDEQLWLGAVSGHRAWRGMERSV